MRPARSFALVSFAVAATISACGGGAPSRSSARGSPTTPPGPAERASAPRPRPSIEVDSLDPSVAPCDDFYRYACGGWMKRHPIPDDRARWGRGDVMAEANLERLRAILMRERVAPSDEEGRKLGAFWAACMDEAKAEDLGPLRRELAAIDRVVDGPSFARAVAHLQTLDASILFDVWASQSFDDATRVVVEIAQGGLGLPDRAYYVDDPKAPDARKKHLREVYVAHVARMLALVGETEDRARSDAATILALETKVAGAHLGRADLRDPKNRFHLLERSWLAKNAAGFAWDAWAARLGVDRVATLNVAQPAFFTRLGEIVRAAPARDLRAYLRWRVLESYAPTLGARIVDERFTYTQALGGAKALPPRWKRCVRAIDGAMSQALGRRFAREVLGDDGQRRASDLLGEVRAAMDATLDAVEWMDEPTRAAAKAKLHAMHAKVGEPTKPIDYAALVVSNDSYFDAMAHANAFALARTLRNAERPFDPDEWTVSPSTGDCFYRWSANDVTAPAGMLQRPLFGAPMTRAMELGALGAYLGHEVTHGFDDEGRKFDAAGNRRDWWSPAIAQRFEARAACVRAELDAATVLDGVHLNGGLTLGESLADLGGMKIAWAAFQRARAERPSVEAFDVPEAKQFFIAYGQFWCRNIRDEALHTMVSTDPHAPPQVRVNHTLSNTPAFAEVFGCTPGSRMVHAPRCEVW